jgi:hypothetical protein
VRSCTAALVCTLVATAWMGFAISDLAGSSEEDTITVQPGAYVAIAAGIAAMIFAVRPTRKAPSGTP